MLDIAWPELMLIGAVALVVIGPKDLPKVMHMMGQWIGKLRRMVIDIRSTMDQLSVEAEAVERANKAHTEKTETQPRTEVKAENAKP